LLGSVLISSGDDNDEVELLSNPPEDNQLWSSKKDEKLDASHMLSPNSVSLAGSFNINEFDDELATKKVEWSFSKNEGVVELDGEIWLTVQSSNVFVQAMGSLFEANNL